MDDLTRTALNLVLELQTGDAWTGEQVREECETIHTFLAGRASGAPDLENLIREVEARVTVRQAPSTSLVDPKGHVEWLQTRSPEIEWNFWDRYRRYLETVQTQPRQVVLRLGDVTDNILRKIEDPARDGAWDRRGLVVGQVQSGKTSNYTGLICKAADAGYRLIIVLAGIHNSLRSQTQLRLDEGFLGFDTQYQQRSDHDGNEHLIGTGALRGYTRLRAASLTSSAENGDFKDAKARGLGLPIGNFPVLLVVKKHTGVLENIRTWVVGMEGQNDPVTGRRTVPDVPLLVIDDEADNASIDTAKIGADGPSATNAAIRKLLAAFDKSAYVGYTATPYANIYIDPAATAVDDKLGDDIFPRSFIESLQPPTNYMGAERVFGMGTGDTATAPLPIHRDVTDDTDWLTTGHTRHSHPAGDLPMSLQEAVRAFILSCAARRARGQTTVHNSMLVHVTRFQDVQKLVSDQLKDELLELQDRLRYGDGDRSDQLLDELGQLWERDFVPTTLTARTPQHLQLSWEQVRAELPTAAGRIEMRTLNGKAREALEYYERRDDGLNVIAVGGNKLSRGLTLEGLTVSYYLRPTKMYDTLMQMGRWFGYRPGYEDLCRLYTTPDLRAWYVEITAAQDELRRELEEMADRGETPEKYGLRIRTSDAGLTITAANKMRRAQRVRLSFNGGIPETTTFDITPGALTANLRAVDALLTALAVDGSPGEAGGNRLWRGVRPALVTAFLSSYRRDTAVIKSRPDHIATYIDDNSGPGKFSSWDVALIGNAKAPAGRRRTTPVGETGLTLRSALSNDGVTDGAGAATTGDNADDGSTGADTAAGGGAERAASLNRQLTTEKRYRIRRVLSPPDESINLDPAQRQAALDLTVSDWRRDPRGRAEPQTASGSAFRHQRRPDQGLLLIYLLDHTPYEAVGDPMVGFVVSFPFAEGEDVSKEYAVNEVWQQMHSSIPPEPEDTDDD